jgi:hypothetical protein
MALYTLKRNYYAISMTCGRRPRERWDCERQGAIRLKDMHRIESRARASGIAKSTVELCVQVVSGIQAFPVRVKEKTLDRWTVGKWK